MTNTKIILKSNQRNRILKVFVLAKLYADFKDFYLHECLLKQTSDYKSAERMSSLMNGLFNQDTKPVDFIVDKDKITNDLIDKSVKFKEFLKNIQGNSIGLNEASIKAFCKNVQHGEYHNLKINNNFYYQTKWLLNYSLDNVSKKDFLEGIKEVNIFSKTKKYNNGFYKRTFIAIENTYNEIMSKQILRETSKTKL